jgi:hypothetical protein
MKHRSLIFCIIAVLALGMMGYGYAAWSSQVAVNATVNTGTFLLGIAPPASGATSEPKGGAACDSVWTTNGPAVTNQQVGSLTETNGSEVSGLSNYYQGVTEAYYNVYPDYDATYTLNIDNGGTIPIKLHTPGIKWTTGEDLSANYSVDSWTLEDITNSGSPVAIASNTDDTSGPFSGIEGTLLPAGHLAQLVVSAHFTDTVATDGTSSMPQNATGAYNITITGDQFNH